MSRLELDLINLEDNSALGKALKYLRLVSESILSDLPPEDNQTWSSLPKRKFYLCWDELLWAQQLDGCRSILLESVYHGDPDIRIDYYAGKYDELMRKS